MTVAPPRPIRLRSARKTLTPDRTASIAAYIPAPPDPMIRTSVSTCMGSALIPAHYSGRRKLSPGRLALAGSNLHGVDDLGVGGAAAEIAGEIVPDLLVVGIGMRVEQLRRHQHETGRAVAALERAGLDEGLLHGRELVGARQRLDRRHLGTVDEGREIEAAGDGGAVHQHRAAAAHALAAAFARAHQIELALQDLDQIVVRLDLGRDRLAVEGEADGAGAHGLTRRRRAACRPWRAAPGTPPRR